MNKLFSLLLIISLLSQTIHTQIALIDPSDLTDEELKVKLKEAIGLYLPKLQTCFKDAVCKGENNVSACQKTVNDSVKWVLEECLNVENARTKSEQMYQACIEQKQGDQTNFKMTKDQVFILQTDYQCKVQAVVSQGKMLCIFGLVLLIFFII